MEEEKTGFVKREDRRELEQSEAMTTKELNLIREINSRTNELLDCLRSTESLSEKINIKLLPQMEKLMPTEGKAEQAPNGWFEEHLADVGCALRKAVNIISNLQNLDRETKTDKVGQ